MEQMKIDTEPELSKRLGCMIMEAIRIMKDSDYKTVHSGMEAYGMATYRFLSVTELYKALKKSMDAIAKSLDGGTDTPARLADAAAYAAVMARNCIMLAAAAENGMEELAKDGTREDENG